MDNVGCRSFGRDEKARLSYTSTESPDATINVKDADGQSAANLFGAASKVIPFRKLLGAVRQWALAFSRPSQPWSWLDATRLLWTSGILSEQIQNRKPPPSSTFPLEYAITRREDTEPLGVSVKGWRCDG